MIWRRSHSKQATEPAQDAEAGRQVAVSSRREAWNGECVVPGGSWMIVAETEEVWFVLNTSLLDAQQSVRR